MPNFQGKVAIITGGSSGIGASTAVEFAKTGCKVAIAGRNTDRLNKTKNDCVNAGLKQADVLAVQTDVTKEADLKNLVDQTVKQFGKINILVNCAGIIAMGPGPATDKIETLDKMMNTNVRGAVILSQLAVPHLKASKNGAIVNVSTMISKQPLKAAAFYGMSKAALDSFTQNLALELGSQGVRVNGVNPAVVKTDIVFTEGVGLTSKEQADGFEKAMGKLYLLGRVAEPEEVAKTIAFLASDDSSFITGQNLNICGGISLTGFNGPLPDRH